MTKANETLELLEFTFWTRISYWICALGGLGVLIQCAYDLVTSGNLPLFRTLAGFLAVVFSLLVFRLRVRQVTKLLPEAIGDSAEGTIEDKVLEALDFRSLARCFVAFGRKRMARELQSRIRELAGNP